MGKIVEKVKTSLAFLTMSPIVLVLMIGFFVVFKLSGRLKRIVRE